MSTADGDQVTASMGSPQPPAVLVVSDREDQRAAIGAILASLDLVVVEAGSPLAASHAALRQTFALILMDAQTATADGDDAASLIESSRTPMIFVAAHVDGQVARDELNVDRSGFTLEFLGDISEGATDADRFEHQAPHDKLTGLPNRSLFEVHIRRALASAKRAGESLAVLAIDLDGLGRVDETLGDDHSDSLLRQASARLVAALREADTVARVGRDELAILPGGATDLAAAAALAWKVKQTFKSGFVVGDLVAHVSARVGIAVFPMHGTTPTRLLDRAQAALVLAKKSGSSQAVFDAEPERPLGKQLALQVDLRHCVDRRELVLHYQPKIDMRTRSLSGVEALLRWRHPIHGLLGPASFMPDVERTELIGAVTSWVLDEALRQQLSWHDQGVDLTMAVNISASSLHPGSDLPDTVAKLTETWSTPPDRLTLELTETTLADAAPHVLAQLHDMGEMVSIDDFGTGHSSLANLQRLPVDEIKIDKSFMTRLAAASDDDVIVRSSIDLAHNLGLTVVAEGVENENILELLSEHECDAVQGYFFARPCAADEFTRWMADSPYAPA